MLGSVFDAGVDSALSAPRAVLCAPPVGGYSSPSTQCAECRARKQGGGKGFSVVRPSYPREVGDSRGKPFGPHNGGGPETALSANVTLRRVRPIRPSGTVTWNGSTSPFA